MVVGSKEGRDRSSCREAVSRSNGESCEGDRADERGTRRDDDEVAITHFCCLLQYYEPMASSFPYHCTSPFPSVSFIFEIDKLDVVRLDLADRLFRSFDLYHPEGVNFERRGEQITAIRKGIESATR